MSCTSQWTVGLVAMSRCMVLQHAVLAPDFTMYWNRRRVSE